MVRFRREGTQVATLRLVFNVFNEPGPTGIRLFPWALKTLEAVNGKRFVDDLFSDDPDDPINQPGGLYQGEPFVDESIIERAFKPADFQHLNPFSPASEEVARAEEVHVVCPSCRRCFVGRVFAREHSVPEICFLDDISLLPVRKLPRNTKIVYCGPAVLLPGLHDQQNWFARLQKILHSAGLANAIDPRIEFAVLGSVAADSDDAFVHLGGRIQGPLREACLKERITTGVGRFSIRSAALSALALVAERGQIDAQLSLSQLLEEIRTA